MPNHAFLSASSSQRWLACPPSAALCAKAGDRGSPYAQQGTDAHALCEFLLNKALGRSCRDPTEDLTWYDQEMRESAEGYVAFVMEQVADAKTRCLDPLICVEETVDFSRWVQDAYGTADALIISDGVLQVTDFKYGVGMVISAAGEDGNGNTQLKLYALASLDTFGNLYNVDRVRLSIYQPRRENVDTFEISVADLLKWADDVLAPTARLAYEGKGDFSVGGHCAFCKVKATCRARAEYNMQLAQYEFQESPKLKKDEIADILTKIDNLVSWAEDVKAYALEQALSGVQYPGYKLVEGRSNRKYADDAAVAKVISDAGYDPYEKKLLGVTAMTRLLGKTKFEELLKGYIVKPQGKPVLVPNSDKRPELNTANNDFMEV